MPYMTYADQLRDHLAFLHSKGLDVNDLKIDAADFVRCHAIGENQSRGKLAYKTTTRSMRNGLVGLGTWCRGVDVEDSFNTYGLPKDGSEPLTKQTPTLPLDATFPESTHKEAAGRAVVFWTHSQVKGESDYLKRKGVGAYGIRFRYSDKYGNVAVVPMYDIQGKLWSYQLLNPDGTKRHPPGSRTKGLFHSLKPIINGQPFGVAESYVTAATCMENTGIACICSFGSNNIKDVIVAISSKYPESPVIIFADNDRHLDQNVGLLKAREAQKWFRVDPILG